MGFAINIAINTSNAIATTLAACLFMAERPAGRDSTSQSLTPATIAASAVVGKVNHLSLCHVLSRMLLTALDRALIKAEQCDAMIYDAQTAIPVERYRLANGKLLKQLSNPAPAFLPAVPSDPFDGKPLRCKTPGKGYIVYSVGEDREDNGGVEKNAKGVSYVPCIDITFTVERGAPPPAHGLLVFKTSTCFSGERGAPIMVRRHPA
jgi:hypothetical protein